MKAKQEIIIAEIIDEEISFTLQELMHAGGATRQLIFELVEYGSLEPMGISEDEWVFNAFALQRVRSAVRLRHDLGINVQGLALILDLLDELNQLRSRIDFLERE